MSIVPSSLWAGISAVINNSSILQCDAGSQALRARSAETSRGTIGDAQDHLKTLSEDCDAQHANNSPTDGLSPPHEVNSRLSVIAFMLVVGVPQPQYAERTVSSHRRCVTAGPAGIVVG